jgi:hypothetical protein
MKKLLLLLLCVPLIGLGQCISGNCENGYGKLVRGCGSIYTGQFKNGCFNGEGTMEWPNGQVYKGEFEDCEYNGQGTYTWTSGTKYIGEWKEGNRNGKGTIFYYDGNKYEGEWKNSNYHGQGTFFYEGGSKYIGEWKDGEEHGSGVKITVWSNNDYTSEKKGFWQNGKYIGEEEIEVYKKKLDEFTKMFCVSGDCEEGIGTYKYATGDIYVGEWRDGYRHGKGTLNRVNSEIQEGLWENDIFKGKE